jgi:DNA invertase Pin-like site-specific DNA recombinase
MRAALCAEAARLPELRRYALARNWEIAGEYVPQQKPDVKALIKDARLGRVGIVLVWSLSCLARRSRGIVLALEELRSLGVEFVSLQERVDTRSAESRAFLRAIASIAALEHRGGRPDLGSAQEVGSPRRTAGRPRKVLSVDQIFELRNSGKSWREIGRVCRAGATTVRHACHQALSQKNQVPRAPDRQ